MHQNGSKTLEELFKGLKDCLEEFKENKKFDPNSAALQATERMLADKEAYLKQIETIQRLNQNLQDKHSELSISYIENKELQLKLKQSENSTKTSKILDETRHENVVLHKQNQNLMERISEYKEEIVKLKKEIHDLQGKLDEAIKSHNFEVRKIKAEGKAKMIEKTNLIEKEMHAELLKYKEIELFSVVEKDKMIDRNKDLIAENTKLKGKFEQLHENIRKLETENQLLLSQLDYEQENFEK